MKEIGKEMIQRKTLFQCFDPIECPYFERDWRRFPYLEIECDDCPMCIHDDGGGLCTNREAQAESMWPVKTRSIFSK
jgi:hypothetical protein